MKTQDLYTLLGVAADASQKEIQDAFHKLALQYHPDVNPGDPHAQERFKIISAAYHVLSDAERRARYDSRMGYPLRPKSQAEFVARHTQTVADLAWRERVSAANHWVATVTISINAFAVIVTLLSPAIGLGRSALVICLSSIVVSGLLFLSLRTYIYMHDHSCPNCGRLWTREELHVEATRIIWVSTYSPARYYPRNIPYQEYLVHGQCRRCAHRWITTRRVRL